jgi:hypothetical protein
LREQKIRGNRNFFLTQRSYFFVMAVWSAPITHIRSVDPQSCPNPVLCSHSPLFIKNRCSAVVQIWILFIYCASCTCCVKLFSMFHSNVNVRFWILFTYSASCILNLSLQCKRALLLTINILMLVVFVHGPVCAVFEMINERRKPCQ